MTQNTSIMPYSDETAKSEDLENPTNNSSSSTKTSDETTMSEDLKKPTNNSNSSSRASDHSSMAAPILPSFTSSKRSSIVLLRMLFVASLVVLVVICFSLSYSMTRNLEEEICIQTYESVALSALDAAKAITTRKIHVGDVMESIMSHAFPDTKTWPMVGLNGYQATASTVAATSGDTSIALVVLVDPSEALEFESHAQQHYRNQRYPEDTGTTAIGFGIRVRDSTVPEGYRIDHEGNHTTYGSSNTVLTPVLDHSTPGSSMMLYNIHASSTAVDSIIECSKDINNFNKQEGEEPNCTVVTGFKLTDEGDLVALIYKPIYPENDPTTLVGMMGLSVNFKDVLVNVVPDYFDGITAVLSTRTETADHSVIDYDTVTYEIVQGVPTLIGEGDWHDIDFHEYGHSIVLNNFHTDVTDAVIYTLTFYPSSLDQFRTQSPIAVSLGFVFIILVSTVIFFLYDYLMRRQSNEQKLILDLKRRFVRFVSHEIRTPLNTVCMGLELLESDMQGCYPAHDQEDGTSRTLETSDRTRGEESLTFWHDITLDIQENAAAAVNILNDLLNYDKIESGTLQLEVSKVNIIDLVIKSAHKFKIQAANKHVALSLKILPCICTLFPGKYTQEDLLDTGNHNRSCPSANQTEIEDAMVVGDEMRLDQVICNLVSNALKFTNHGGSITVCMEHLSPPDCSPLRRSSNRSETSSRYVTCRQPQRGSVRISVRDTGVGMTKEQLAQTFAEGVQFDANKLQGGGGSGLGLSISKGIVERHNGVISATSDGPNAGSVFTVELPLYTFKKESPEFNANNKVDHPKLPLHSRHCEEVIELSLNDSNLEQIDGLLSPRSQLQSPSLSNLCKQSSQDDIPKQETTAVLSTAPPPKTHHVLVVEDVLSSQKMLIRLLKRASCTCVAASNGQKAVDAVKATLCDEQQQPFDTILMDYEMPVLNGPDASTKIRELGYKGLILGVTGNVLAEDVEFFVSKGADSVVAKPVSIKVLQDVWSTPQDYLQKQRRRLSNHQYIPNNGSSKRTDRPMLKKLSSSEHSLEHKNRSDCLDEE